MDSFQIHYQWRAGGGYNFGQRFTLDFRRAYCRPAIYRWRLLRNAGEQKEPIYIGEAEDVVRRIQRVMTPGKKASETNTNYRLNKLFPPSGLVVWDNLRVGRDPCIIACPKGRELRPQSGQGSDDNTGCRSRNRHFA